MIKNYRFKGVVRRSDLEIGEYYTSSHVDNNNYNVNDLTILQLIYSDDKTIRFKPILNSFRYSVSDTDGLIPFSNDNGFSGFTHIEVYTSDDGMSPKIRMKKHILN